MMMDLEEEVVVVVVGVHVLTLMDQVEEKKKRRRRRGGFGILEFIGGRRIERFLKRLERNERSI